MTYSKAFSHVRRCSETTTRLAQSCPRCRTCYPPPPSVQHTQVELGQPLFRKAQWEFECQPIELYHCAAKNKVMLSLTTYLISSWLKDFSLPTYFFHLLLHLINNWHMATHNFVFVTSKMKKMVICMLELVGTSVWQIKFLRGIWKKLKYPTPRKYFLFLSQFMENIILKRTVAAVLQFVV